MAPPLAIKKLDDGSSLIVGWLAPYGGPAYLAGKDLHRQRFTPETDFALKWYGDWQRPLLYDHGLDPTLKAEPVGRIALELRDKGVWMQAQIDAANEYRAEIEQLVSEGKLGASSGSMAHLVRVDHKSGDILAWPIVEGSLTPAPANPEASIGYAVKRADAERHVLAVVKSVDELPDPNPLKFEPAAYDAATGANLLAQLYPLLATETDDAAEPGDPTADEQVTLLTTAVDAIEQWLALESDEIGTPEEQADQLEPAVMSYAIRGWRRRSQPAPVKEGRRNSASDAEQIQTIHDTSAALGATCPPATDVAKSKAAPAVAVLGVTPGDGAVKAASDEARRALRDELATVAAESARRYLNLE